MNKRANYLFLIIYFFSFNSIANNLAKNLVYTNPYGGLGDIFSAIKIATFLAKNNLTTALYIDTSDESNAYLRNRAHLANAKRIVEDKSVIFITSDQQALDFKPANLWVVTGKPKPTLRNGFGAQRAFIIYEYNQKSLLSPQMFGDSILVKEIETGFDKDGIFNLEQEKISTITPIQTWVQNNQQKLNHLPPNVQNMLANGDYFFGYANGRNHGFDLNAYVAGVARYALLNGKKDIVFFLAGDLNNTMGNSNLFDFIDEDEFASCSTYSISGQTTYLNQNNVKLPVENTYKSNKLDGLNLYIIRGRVDNDDFLTLLKGSHYPFALVTGDQSFSEAVSLGKVPIYQSLSHKSKVIPGLIAKISPIDRELAVIIDDLVLKHTYKDGHDDPSDIAKNIQKSISKIMLKNRHYQEEIMRVTRENNLLNRLLN